MKFALLIISVIIAMMSVQDTDPISFTGVTENIKYTVNRQIAEARFVIKNNTKEELTVKAGHAFLVRGKSSEALEKVSMKAYYQNKTRKLEEFILRPRQQINVYFSFKPFTVYTGSNYSILAEVYVKDKKYKATTVFEIRKLEQNDRNSLKNSDK